MGEPTDEELIAEYNQLIDIGVQAYAKLEVDVFNRAATRVFEIIAELRRRGVPDDRYTKREHS